MKVENWRLGPSASGMGNVLYGVVSVNGERLEVVVPLEEVKATANLCRRAKPSTESNWSG